MFCQRRCAVRPAERWLCVEHTMPSLFCIDTDASQYELMT